MKFKSSKSEENRKKNHEAQFPKLSVFIGKKSVFRRYCMQNVKDGIQIQVYNTMNECLNHFSLIQ